MGLLNLSLLVRWGLGWLLCLRMPALAAGVVRGHPSVAVLIPARNEESTLPHLLRALEAQSFRPLEVIVIDDHSSDRTAAIATQTSPHLEVRLVRPPPLPEGWCGKTWALHNGVAASRAEVLVFLDADTEPAPDFLASLLACHQELGGLVSVQPYHRTERAYEQLSVLFNLVGMMAVPLGPRGEVRKWRLVAVLLWLSGLFWAAWCLPASLLDWPMLGDRGLAANLLLYGCFAAQLLVITRRVGSFGWINLIFPVPVLFFLGVFVLAIANLERGTVRWKGRTLSTRP
ncbi:MAG: glycosyltransferase family A protein [Cyanobacteria bacterium]|nr:glycosyltransferase family A protein [Cyanobacteriota bacterium]